MWVELGNLSAQVTRSTAEERTFLRNYLTFSNPKAHFSGGPARITLYDDTNDSFPAGLYNLVRKVCERDSIKLESFDRRKKPIERDVQADLGWLRWYQKEAIDRAASKGRGILKLPTGAGKTEIMVGLTRAFPCRWLMIVHRTGLMHQAAERFEKRNEEHGLDLGPAGRVGEGKFSIGDRFTCATFTSLVEGIKSFDPQVMKLLEETEAVVIDECHTLPADTHWNVCMKLRNAYYRFGVSGTPLARDDRKSQLAIAALGPLIYEVPTQVLVKEGVLAKAHITMIECAQRSDKPTWQGVYGEQIVRSGKRNRLLIKAIEKADKPCMLFVKELNHGKILKKMMEVRGLRCMFIFGQHAEVARKRALQALATGRLDVVIASVVFQEGVDVPELRSVINGSGGKSIIAALQKIGRGMRVDVASGKDTFQVFDILDRGCGCAAAAKSLGTPGRGLHSGCKWLDKHSHERQRAYMKEGHVTVVEQWVDASSKSERDADETVTTIVGNSRAVPP